MNRSYKEELEKPGPSLYVMGRSPLQSGGASSPAISLNIQKIEG